MQYIVIYQSMTMLANRRGDTLPLEQLNLETFADAIEVILLGMEALTGQYPEKETD